MYLYLGLAFILLLITIIKQKSPFTQDQQMWAMSFGGGSKNFNDSVDRIHKELTDINVFDKVLTYKEDVLKNDSVFWKKHGTFIETNKRGYGYWIWKSYLILKTMERMNDGDILFYIDSGCEVINDTRTKPQILAMKEKCENILYSTTGEIEKKYTKMDVLNKLGLQNKDTEQNQAGLLFLKKTNLIQEFIKDWYENSSNYPLVDDSSSFLENDVMFVDHRHDQSIFSLLIKSDKYKTELNQPNNILHDLHPFLLSRKRSG